MNPRESKKSPVIVLESTPPSSPDHTVDLQGHAFDSEAQPAVGSQSPVAEVAAEVSVKTESDTGNMEVDANNNGDASAQPLSANNEGSTRNRKPTVNGGNNSLTKGDSVEDDDTEDDEAFLNDPTGFYTQALQSFPHSQQGQDAAKALAEKRRHELKGKSVLTAKQNRGRPRVRAFRRSGLRGWTPVCRSRSPDLAGSSRYRSRSPAPHSGRAETSTKSHKSSHVEPYVGDDEEEQEDGLFVADRPFHQYRHGEFRRALSNPFRGVGGVLAFKNGHNQNLKAGEAMSAKAPRRRNSGLAPEEDSKSGGLRGKFSSNDLLSLSSTRAQLANDAPGPSRPNPHRYLEGNVESRIFTRTAHLSDGGPSRRRHLSQAVVNDEDEYDENQYDEDDEGGMFYNHGANLPLSRYSGGEERWAINQMPPAVPQNEVSDAALLRRNLSRGNGEMVIKRGYGANDPENIQIVNLREDGHSFSEIKEILNDVRVEKGKIANLSVDAVTSRYNRTAPLFFQAQGIQFVPLNQRPHNRAPNKGRHTGRPAWTQTLDLEMVQLVQAYDSDKWTTVSDDLFRESGIRFEPRSIAQRYALL